MPTGDGVQKRPTLEQEVAKFTGFTTQEGEIVDPKAENLNPTSQNISADERKAGTKTVQEAEDSDGDDSTADTAAAAKGREGVQESSGDDSAASDKGDGSAGDEDGAGDDDTKTITVAQAKRNTEYAIKKRYGELKRENRALHTKLSNLRDVERRLDAIEGLTPEKKAATETADKAPLPDDFEFGEMDAKFIRALARYEARQETQAAQRTAEEKQQREAAARQERELATKKTALEAAGEKDFDDFHEVVVESAEWSLQNQDAPEAWPLSAVVGELAFDSKAGHKVLYHLATHPDEARQVYALSPGAQGAWFARKEQEFSPASDAPAKPAAKTSKAPPPPKHNARGGNGRNPVATDSSDFAAVEAQWRNQRRTN